MKTKPDIVIPPPYSARSFPPPAVRNTIDNAARHLPGGIFDFLLISTPQSIAKPSPGWNKVALLTAVRNPPCSCPFSVSLHPPLAALNSEPRPGSLFIANQKLSPLAGKVARSAERGAAKNSRMPRVIPPSASLTLSSSPVSRWSLWVQYRLSVQCRTPSRSDRFNGVTGGAGGPKGRNRNLPRPPCKKGYKETPFSFVYLNPSVTACAVPAPRPGSLNSLRKFAYSEFPAPSVREPFGALYKLPY